MITTAVSGADLVTIAWSRDRGTPLLAGVLVSIQAMGALLGGSLGGFISSAARVPRRVAAVAVSMLLLVPVFHPLVHGSPLIVGAAMAASGAAIAPAFAAIFTHIAEATAPTRCAETFGWADAAFSLGGAVSTPVIGGLIDVGGPALGIGAAALAAAASALSFRARRPGPGVARAPATSQ